jgi:hypothetical protein
MVAVGVLGSPSITAPFSPFTSGSRFIAGLPMKLAAKALAGRL